MMSREERKLLDDAKRIIVANKDVPGGMEEIKKVMTTVYKYFKRVIDKADFNDRRLIEIFSLERLLEDKYLTLNNEPIYDPDNAPSVPMSVRSEEDCVQLMKCIVHETREWLSRHNDVKKDSLAKQCIDTSWQIQTICEKIGVSQKRYGCSENLDYGTYHYFNVVSFDLPNGETKHYLIDCTYRQFFTYSEVFLERIGLPLNSGPSMGAYMMMDEERKKIAEEILTKGFIEFTPDVIKAYFDAFIFSGRNGLYYEKLGKKKLSKADYEPHYTCEDYLYALNNRGIKEDDIDHQFECIGDIIDFDYTDGPGIKLT